MTVARATPESRVRLHDLASRRDGQEWIVGRVATGEFVSVPGEAMTFLRSLHDGGTVADAKEHTDLVHGQDIDALDFIGDLIGLGFVAAVDGERIAEEQPRPPSLPWLRPRHVSWLFRAPALIAVAAFICGGITAAAVSGSFPGYSAFFALREPGLDCLLAGVICMAILALHELSHLAAARAADVHGWFGWSTRMCFLVAQTSVPGLWMEGRAVRLRVFLAGMVCDLVIFSACSMGMASCSRTGVTHHVLMLTSLIALLGVMEQFLFFMRTDVYLVVQELTGCKNLFADATGYLSYVARGLASRGRTVRPNPLSELPPGERRPVRAYAAVVIAGCAAMVAVTACYALPVEIGIYMRATGELARGLSSSRAAPVLDGAGVLVVALVFQALLVRTLLRTYRSHLRRLWLSARRTGETRDLV
jgi:putative peptide zinc metalloprotease protein